MGFDGGYDVDLFLIFSLLVNTVQRQIDTCFAAFFLM